MNDVENTPLSIGIIGAGFSGVALLGAVSRQANRPVEIHIFEKTGKFGLGQAYSTPYSFHLLNAKVKDMSAFADEPDHFTKWLENNEAAQPLLDSAIPLTEQFVSRSLYRDYMDANWKALQKGNRNVVIKAHVTEVTALQESSTGLTIITADGQQIPVDKAVLSTGVVATGNFPFPVECAPERIIQPWNYTQVASIPREDPVFIVGTGLSMIDAVLTLHHNKHKGPIVAVSRHGLLPLPHAAHNPPQAYQWQHIPETVPALLRSLRQESKKLMSEGGDWRNIINALRPLVPGVWEKLSLDNKKTFLRHLLPYWNIHRHRVHDDVYALLQALQADGKLEILAGRVQSIKADKAHIVLRHHHDSNVIPAKWFINCMGFTFKHAVKQQPLYASLIDEQHVALDPLLLGLETDTNCVLRNAKLYTLGPPMMGMYIETVAVPEISQQCVALARHILAHDEKMSGQDVMLNTVGRDR